MPLPVDPRPAQKQSAFTRSFNPKANVSFYSNEDLFRLKTWKLSFVKRKTEKGVMI